MSKIRMVGIGSSVYDTLMLVDRFPTEDTKMEGAETKVQGGGPCATALTAAQKLGIQTAYLGQMGDDPFGRFMLEDFRKRGVDVSHVKLIPDTVSFHSVVILNRAQGSRTCIWNRGTTPQPDESNLDTGLLAEAEILHLDGHMTAFAALAARTARDAGTLVSYDAGGMYPGIDALLPLADILIPSEEFALKLTGLSRAEDAAEEIYRRYSPRVEAVTQGVKGGVIIDEKGLRRYPAFRVDAVDTNGSGDTFHGAFDAPLLKAYDHDAAARYASAAAAIKCTRLGARDAMPTHEEVLAFLRERGEIL
jgi:sugar/nucleoside kinase (ribokinase family)